MIVTKKTKHGIDFYKVWFASEPCMKSGIIEYHQASYDVDNSDEFDTLITDISGTPEEIKSRFAKNCKYKVNRAEREEIEVSFSDNDDITDEAIEDFIHFFKAFWESKGSLFSEEESIRLDLHAYRDAGALSFSKAFVKGELAVYHTHIYDKNRARLLHSASLYRLMNDDESESRNLVGMANRYLHFADMLHFKEKGLKLYDWGGAGRGEDVINITRFKESFGGFAERSYDYEEVNGLKAKLFKFVVNVLDDSLINRFRG